VAFDRLLAELSAGFIHLPAHKVDGAITDSLRHISAVLGVDRTMLIRFADGVGVPRVTHSGAVQGIPEGSPDGALAKLFPWSIPRLLAGHTIVFGRLDELPQEAAIDKASYLRHRVKAGLVVPLNVAGAIEGCIALDCAQAERSWPQDVVERMRVMSTVFGSALAHKRTLEELDTAISFERVASDMLAALLKAPRAEQDRVVEAALRAVAQAFGADRATLWQRVGDQALFTKTHRGLADGLPAPPEALRTPSLPWITAQLLQGSIVRFTRHVELPREAAADLEALQALRIGAAVVVPLLFSGQVAGALSIASAQEYPAWPQALAPRLQLLGEAFASFLARQDAERREQEAVAQAAHAARVGTMGVFAASLVHELTQPLAASLANAETAAELLEPKRPDLDDLRATVADIVADSRRAGAMIQRLRRFLRHGEAERTELDVAALLAEVLTFVKSEAAGKRVEISLDVQQPPLRIVGDRVQLQQVLLNLLLNALDAVAGGEPGTRTVDVRARPSDTGISIEVSDCGAGMDEATLARIYQPFFTTKPGGMGLGLSISHTIVATHGGTLTARSALGQGSTFRLELPLRQALVIAPVAVPAMPANAGGTVFVIDDDDAMRRALERQLNNEGYRVETFANAHAFLDRAPHADVACIVSDVRMPGMSGLDLQATLARAKVEWPIVFISGHADVPTTVHAMKAGAVAFLPKPFAKLELLAGVADALARSRERDHNRRRDAEVLARHASLTPREHEVFDLVVAGLLNKLIADRLGIAEATVKIHRGRVMEKMRARSVASLARMAQCVALHAASAPVLDQEPVRGGV
jgi:FixJ family two-component response regulator/signal transduction histidine kinase